MSELKTCLIGDVAEIIGGGTPSTKNEENFGGDIPWITPKDLSDHDAMYISKGERSITSIGLENSSAKLLPANSILFTSRAPIGYVALAKNEIATNQGFKSLVLKDDNDPKFFYYLLKNITPQIKSYASGSTFQEISGKVLSTITIKIPNANIQKRIGEFIEKFDKKIELNKKTNETLECIAKAVFKSWFIDFDPVKAKSEGRSTGLPDEISDLFPDSFEDSELGNIPKNWGVKKLGNIISIKYGKNFPTKNLVESGFPVFGGNGIIGYHSSFLYKEEMTLMSCRGAASGSILRSLPESFITNNSLVMDHTSNKFPSQRYIEYFLQSTDRSGFITGSAQPQVTIESIYDLSFLVPNYELVEYFQNLINPLNQKSLLIMKQNKNLELLRNTLLPKLISGELRILDAEKMIEEVGI